MKELKGMNAWRLSRQQAKHIRGGIWIRVPFGTSCPLPSQYGICKCNISATATGSIALCYSGQSLGSACTQALAPTNGICP
jgi:hypothetical protein